MSNMALSLKQKTFCQEYIVDFNGAQSAIRAGYSKKTAKVKASQLLTIINIQSEILAAIKKRSERTGITQDRVVLELARIAFSDMKDFAAWDKSGVTLNDSETLTEEETRCVSEVSETETKDGGSVKFKLHDKKSALELLGKHLGMFGSKFSIDSDDFKIELTLVGSKDDPGPVED